MTSNDFVPVDEIVAEAAMFLDDTHFNHGASRPFYELIVHREVEHLAINTFFAKITKDIFDWNACGEGIIAMPKNMFNIRNIYLFNSSCDKEREIGEDGCGCGSECCKSKQCWSEFVEAHWKREFNKFGSTRIKTAKVAPDHNDPVYGNYYNGSNPASSINRQPGVLVYYGVQNGEICISDSGLKYKNMRIVSNTFGTDNCKLPIIPRALRRACVDKCILDVCTKIMRAYPEYKEFYKIYYSNYYGDGGTTKPGSYLEAERYVKRLDTKSRNDMFEYFGNIEIK